MLKTTASLGYGEQDQPLISVKRLARIPIAPGSTPPIALKFAFKFARDEFYSRYLRSRKLTLEHLGFNVNKRVYLNENLTELARKVKTHAVKLKKAGKQHLYEGWRSVRENQPGCCPSDDPLLGPTGAVIIYLSYRVILISSHVFP